MSGSDLLATIAEIGRTLPQGGAAQLADVVSTSKTPDHLAAKADGLPSPVQQKQAARLARSWADESISGDALALGLRAAQAAAEAERLSESVSLIWTGPKSSQVAVARNDQALMTLIDAAASELLVVSYAAYQMPQLVEKLGEAVGRGVAVNLILEFYGSQADQPQEWNPVVGLGGSMVEGVVIYEWPIELRKPTPLGKVGYLHVKCAVADRRKAFVSSANLTMYAMEMNMELGVAIEGGQIPGRIASHFRSLIDEGTLRRWQPRT